MALWEIKIGHGGTQRTQDRVTSIIVDEEFAIQKFTVTVKTPLASERTQVKGRINDSLIQIIRGSTTLLDGFIEDVESGADYVKYTGRSFIVMLGYSPNSETDGTSGETKAEYSGQTGAVICDDLIDEFCHHVNGDSGNVRDSTLTYSDITFAEVFDGDVKIHGAQKVYDVIKNMVSMYGKDVWADATWAGTTLTNKNIHIGDRSRGNDGAPHDTLTGGVNIADIPVIKYRSSQVINCLRVLGKGSGKEQIAVWVQDDVSVAAIGYVEGAPYHSNLILSEDTATAIGNAIITAKKDPIVELKIVPITYIYDLRYGDWVKIVDTYSGIDTTKRIIRISHIYSANNIDSMRISLGDEFDNYENIIRDLTKLDVNEEPEMTLQGGSFRLTANKPPSDYVRHDPGSWYDTTGSFQDRGKGVCPFWTYANNPAIGAFMKALVQISDAGSVTYKLGSQEITAGAAEGTTVSVDALNTPLGEVILKGKSGVPGAYVVEDVYDDGNESYSYIYKDVRPIIGSSATGLGGSSPWEVSGSYSQLITARAIDMRGYEITKIADLKGSLNADFSLYGSNSADSAWVEFLQWDHSTEQVLISRNTDLYDASTISPELKFRVPLDEGYSGFYIDYHSVDGVLRFRNITGDTDVVTFSDTGRVNLIDDIWMTKGKEINFGTPNTAYIYQDAATNDLKFYDTVLGATKTLSELVLGGLWEVSGSYTILSTARPIDMLTKDIIKCTEISGQTTGTDGIDRLSVDFRGDAVHRIWYTGISDNRLKYETYAGHLFSINTADICQVSSTGLHMASGKYIKSASGDLELRAPSGSKIKFVIG